MLTDERISPGEGDVEAEPLIIDSWLVEDGCVRGIELHEDRFRLSCAKLLPSISAAALDAFVASVRALLPRQGRWFPRIEAYAPPRSGLALRIRRAPEYPGPIALWVPPLPDLRRRPEVKGPDLAALAALRAQARSAGSDDTLLYTVDGYVLEAAHSAVVWWRGDTLCAPAAELPVLPSVTMTFLAALGEHFGVKVSREHCRLDELLDLPVWSINALHGIRPVCRWLTHDGMESQGVAGPNAERWIAWLDGHKIPIDRASDIAPERLEKTAP